MDVAVRAPIATLKDIERVEAQPYDEAVPFRSTYDVFRIGAERHGDRPALTFLPTGDPADEPVVFDYRALLANITRAANLFRALGVGEGDAVAMLLPGVPEAHFTLWGAEVAGRACPINFMLNPDHIAELIEAAGAKVLVALGPDPVLDIWSKVEGLRARCPGLRAVLQVGGDPAGGDGFASFETELAAQPDTLGFERTIGRDDIAAYFHTGGTTGAPKLAQHRHGNEVHTAWSAALMYDMGPDDVMVNGFPLFHVAGSFVYGLSTFVAGGNMVAPTRLGLRDQAFMTSFWRFVEKHRATMVAGVPTLVATLLGTPFDGADVSSLRVVWTGGSPLPSELAAAFERDMGLPVRNILGMTESAGILTISPLAGERVPGATGLRLPYTEVRAVPLAPDGPMLDEVCAPNEPGVIVARGPNVGPGYTDPARNPGTFERGGWLVSGDLGHVDEAGYVYVTGRAKDVIIRGAHNIDPATIEEVLAAHPAVEMAAAVGQPDAYAGELPAAFVTLKEGRAADPAALVEFAAPRIAERAALPKHVAVLDEMPLTAVGKIYKPALRVKAIERVFGEALAELAGQGIALRVEGVDAKRGLSARIVVTAAPDRAAAEAAIGERLRDFAVPHEIVWA